MFGVGLFALLGVLAGQLLLVLTQALTFFGDSLMAGNVAPGAQIWAYIQRVFTGQPIVNAAVGGTTTAQILLSVQTAPGSQTAASVVFNGGRNDIATAAIKDVPTNIAGCVTVFGSNDYYFYFGMPVASVEPRGSLNWSQVTWANRVNMGALGAHYCDMWRFSQQHGNGSAQDNADIAADLTPSSLRVLPDGTTNTLHFGAAGNVLFAGLVQSWEQARFASGVYVQPYTEYYLTGATATAAQAQGGAVCTLSMYGTPDTIAISSGDPTGDFTIDASGHVTRASTLFIQDQFRQLTITATKGGQSSTGIVKVFFGSANTTPVDVAVDGTSWAVEAFVPTTRDSNQFSMVIALQCAAGTDGTDMYLVAAGSPNKALLHRNTANRLALIIKNAAGTTVASIQSASSGAGLITHASGTVYCFLSVDLSGAGGSANCRFFVNETSSLSFLVGTGGATMDLSERQLIGAQTTNGLAPFIGNLRTVWLTGTFVDWATAGNRALFYDHTTGAPVDIGATGAITPSGGSLITPYIYSAGNPGDIGRGINGGSGGPLVMACPPSGQIVYGGLFVNPSQVIYLTGAASAAAQTNGGAVGTVVHTGAPTSFAITAGDATNFALSSVGAITRATGTQLSDGYYDLTAQATQGSLTSSGAVRILIGAPDTVPRKVTTNGRTSGYMPVATSLPDSGQITVVAALKPGSDDVALYFAGGDAGRFLIQRTAGNRISITGKNSSAVTVLSLQTTATHVAADGLVWVFACADLALGASSCHLFVGEANETNVLVAAADVIDFSHRYVLWAQDLAGDNPWNGDGEMLWIGQGYLDISQAGNRALFYTAATNAAKDLGATGAVAGVTPLVYVEGWAADWTKGHNRGSGGDFAMTVGVGATITTSF